MHSEKLSDHAGYETDHHYHVKASSPCTVPVFIVMKALILSMMYWNGSSGLVMAKPVKSACKI